MIKPGDVLRAEYYVNPGESFVDLLHYSRLLRHASAYTEHEVGSCLFDLLELPQCAEKPLVGVVPDAAGIYHGNVRPVRIIAVLISERLKQTRDILRVVFVHLASVCNDIVFTH
jgi:hypothetical protein